MINQQLLLFPELDPFKTKIKNIDYVDIKKGDIAEFDGKLFKNEAIAKILADLKLDNASMRLKIQEILLLKE